MTRAAKVVDFRYQVSSDYLGEGFMVTRINPAGQGWHLGTWKSEQIAKGVATYLKKADMDDREGNV